MQSLIARKAPRRNSPLPTAEQVENEINAVTKRMPRVANALEIGRAELGALLLDPTARAEQHCRIEALENELRTLEGSLPILQKELVAAKKRGEATRLIERHAELTKANESLKRNLEKRFRQLAEPLAQLLDEIAENNYQCEIFSSLRNMLAPEVRASVPALVSAERQLRGNGQSIADNTPKILGWSGDWLRYK